MKSEYMIQQARTIFLHLKREEIKKSSKGFHREDRFNKRRHRGFS